MRTEFYILILLVVGFLIGHRCNKDCPGETPTPKVDTLFIHDTIKVTEPKYVTKRVIDSVPYPVTDTLRLKDTLYVILKREQIRWEDSLSVVYASGVNPHVDSVIHFTQAMVITKEIPVIKVKKTRWGIGIQAGVTLDGNGKLTPYVGGGATYNLLSW